MQSPGLGPLWWWLNGGLHLVMVVLAFLTYQGAARDTAAAQSSRAGLLLVLTLVSYVLFGSECQAVWR